MILITDIIKEWMKQNYKMNIERKKIFLKWLIGIMVCCFLFSLSGCSGSTTMKTSSPSDADAVAVQKASEGNAYEKGLDKDGFLPCDGYVKTIRNDVKIMKSPKDGAKVFITLQKGVQLPQTGTKDKWTRVRINESYYYVETSLVEKTAVKWATESDAEKISHVIFLDPAKQITEDETTEDIFPAGKGQQNKTEVSSGTDAENTNPKMTAASVGVSSGTFEYDVTMNAMTLLANELKHRGYIVIMSRTNGNANLSNARRAEMANEESAELYLRFSAGGVSDPSASGIIGFITTSENQVTSGNYQKNYEVCYDILKNMTDELGTERLGIYETDTMTNLNYCDMPAVSVNIGFLSNEQDDKNLNDQKYLEKMADAAADGIDEYFEEETAR